MTDVNTRSNFTNRQFVAMVRDALAAAGRPDVTIERSWIDEDEPGIPFQVHVPVGTEVSVPLTASDGILHLRLGSGLVDQSQKMTVAASAMAEKKTVGHRS